MPLSPTTYMLLIRPTPGGDDDVWDDLWNTIGGQVDGHRHITGEGRPIPSAGIGIDAALPFNNFRATSIAGLAMQNLAAALTTGANEFFVTGGNAYFRSGGGTNVQITSGGTLAVTVAGAFGGDYTAVGAEAAFTDATDTYSFKQQLGAAVRQYGKMASADLLLFEYKAHPAAGVPTNAIRLKSPASLAASYDWIFAGALPGSQQIVQVDNVGNLTYSNTIPQAATFSALITASLGLTAAANQHITVSGTGEYKHGDVVRNISGAAGISVTSFSYVSATGSLDSSALGAFTIAIPLKVGDRIKTVTYSRSGDGAVDVSNAQVSRWTNAGVLTDLGSTTESNVGARADTTINVTDTVIASGDTVLFELAVNAAAFRFYNLRVTYDHP